MVRSVPPIEWFVDVGERRARGTAALDIRHALAWCDAHLDALGREAVRRWLAGEQFQALHPEVPEAATLLLRAHEASGPRDALDVAVAAHRIVTGIAWRWIGARYLLADTALAPDLADRRDDGEKVTGSPYAEAAREAVNRLVRAGVVGANQLAAGQERGLAFGTVARRWHVSDDLIGATLGPGAPRWVERSALQDLDESYYRVAKQGAAWTRP